VANTLAQNPTAATFTGAASVNKAFASGGTNPSLYVAALAQENGSATITVSDNQNGGNYTEDAIGTSHQGATGAGTASVYSKQNTSTSIATITATLSASSNAGTLKTFEFTGAPTSSVVDAAVSDGTASDYDTCFGALTTSSANCSIVACGVQYGGQGSTPDSGFTNDAYGNAYGAYQVVEHLTDAGAATSRNICFGGTASSTYYGAAMAAVAYKTSGGGGTTYNQSASGSITVSGLVVKQTNKTPTGSITPAGAIVKSTLRKLVGSITGAGAIVRSTARNLAGSITGSGAVQSAAAFFKSVGGSITAAGALVTELIEGAQTFFQTVTGSITAAGSVLRAVTLQKAVSGSLTAAGALVATLIPFVPGLVRSIVAMWRRRRRM